MRKERKEIKQADTIWYTTSKIKCCDSSETGTITLDLGIRESIKEEVLFYLSLQAWIEFKYSHWETMGRGINYVCFSQT